MLNPGVVRSGVQVSWLLLTWFVLNPVSRTHSYAKCRDDIKLALNYLYSGPVECSWGPAVWRGVMWVFMLFRWLVTFPHFLLVFPLYRFDISFLLSMFLPRNEPKLWTDPVTILFVYPSITQLAICATELHSRPQTISSTLVGDVFPHYNEPQWSVEPIFTPTHID